MGLNEQAGLDSRQGWMGEKLDQVNIVFNFFLFSGTNMSLNDAKLDCCPFIS